MAKFCGTCGAELNKQTGFCPACGGAPVEEEKPPEDVPLESPVTAAGQRRASFCGKCGKPADPQTGYCAACGVMTRYAPVPAAQAAPQPPKQKVPKQKKKKRGRAALWIVTIVAVLLAAAAVVGVLVHFGVADIPAVRDLEMRMGILPYADETTPDNDDVLQENDAVESEPADYEIYEYDDEGRLIKCRNYDDSGTQRSCYTYKYDSAGQMIRKICYEYNGRGILSGYTIYEYDSTGQLTKVREYSGSNVLQATYDGDWNQIG